PEMVSSFPQRNGREGSVHVQSNGETADKAFEQLRAVIAEFQASAQRDPSILDWDTGMNLISAFPTIAVCTPLAGSGALLAYLDHSIDIVVTPPGAPEYVAEARRVASAAIVWMEKDGSFKVEWVQTPRVGGFATAVSIIIPVFNNSSYTDSCLKQLTET